MDDNNAIQLFEDKKIRTAWDHDTEEWYFSIVDVVGVLTMSPDPSAYWRKMKERLKKEGDETVTNCHSLRMKAADGKRRQTDVANTEQLMRLTGITSASTAPIGIMKCTMANSVNFIAKPNAGASNIPTHAQNEIIYSLLVFLEV